MTLHSSAVCSAALIVLLAVPLVGCGGENPPEASTGGGQTERDHEEHGDEGGVVHLTAEQVRAGGITLETAAPGRVDLGVELPGEVRPNGDRLAHIVPRFPGIVRTVHKNVGDRVQAGEVLAVIESSESLAPYELKTLLEGTVIEKHLTRGEAVNRDTPTFVVADLSTVWVELSVYQQDMGQVRVGSPVRVTVAHGLPQAEGMISYVTPTIDEASRTATARVVLPNTDGVWRPGMFVTARVLEAAEVPVLVPTTALQTVEQRSVVFVETDEGFEARPVTLGRRGETHAEIVAGLSPGERYAASNSFLLKAELGKGAAEHHD